MLKAVVIDRSYGSGTGEELEKIARAYAKAGLELVIRDESTEDGIIEACRGAYAMLMEGNPPVTRRVLSSLPELKFIQRFGIGFNSIDTEAATEHGKIVLNLQGFCVQELADLATAMIMGLIRNVCFYDRNVRSGNWLRGKHLRPANVRNMTLGLYGFGAAAKCLYPIFKNGFGTRILACDPYVPENAKARYDVEFVTFDELIAESDIISLHAPLTEETYHIFNRDVFRRMKNTAMIINTARGALIDEDALIWALRTGEITYAGLDTFEREPLPADSPLARMDNVILNPHSGFYGRDSKKRQIETICSLVPDALTKGVLPLRNVVNKAVLKNGTPYALV